VKILRRRNIQHVMKLQNHTYRVYRIACQGDRLVNRDASIGDRGVLGGIVPAIDIEQRDDISYPEVGSSLESSGSAHQTEGSYVFEDVPTH
jgi:hypothetical protein